MFHKYSLAIIILSSTLFMNCNDHSLIPLDRAIKVERIDVTAELTSNLVDILWIIDSSPTMCQEQASIQENFTQFVVSLSDMAINFHMAVITVDMETDRGAFRRSPGVVMGRECANFEVPTCPPQTGPVLRRQDYLVNPNNINGPIHIDDLLADFRCISTVGTTGSGFEKAFDSMRRALQPDMLAGANAGFRRDNAWLAIVFITDENDCSDSNSLVLVHGNECEWRRREMTPVQEYVDFIRAMPGTNDGDNVLVAAIVGPDNGIRFDEPRELRPSCSTAEMGSAYAGYRYHEFVDHFGYHGTTADICHDPFSVALDNLSRIIRTSLAVRCLRTSPRTCLYDHDCDEGSTCIDPNPDTPGITGLMVCDDFELAIEVLLPETTEWSHLRGEFEEDPQYEMRWDHPQCETGLGIEFTAGNEPPPRSRFRIRYPVQITLDD